MELSIQKCNKKDQTMIYMENSPFTYKQLRLWWENFKWVIYIMQLLNKIMHSMVMKKFCKGILDYVSCMFDPFDLLI